MTLIIPPLVARAVKPGHDLAWDPPAAHGRVERWTCTRCHAAVLRNDRHIYGSATKQSCEDAQAAAERWST